MKPKFIKLDARNWREQRWEVFSDQFDWSQIDTVLYVGARKHDFYLRNVLDRNNVKITILEAFEPNVKLMSKDKSLEVFHGDATLTDLGRKFDMVLFWNGPEHLTVDDIPKATENLKKMTNKYLVYGVPYGKRPQGVLYDNQYEIHRSTLLAKNFPGFKRIIIGVKDNIYSQLIAIKDLSCE